MAKRPKLSNIPMPKGPSAEEEEMGMMEEFPELADLESEGEPVEGEEMEMEMEGMPELADISDDDLMAEAKARGLLPETEEDMMDEEEGMEPSEEEMA